MLIDSIIKNKDLTDTALHYNVSKNSVPNFVHQGYLLLNISVNPSLHLKYPLRTLWDHFSFNSATLRCIIFKADSSVGRELITFILLIFLFRRGMIFGSRDLLLLFQVTTQNSWHYGGLFEVTFHTHCLIRKYYYLEGVPQSILRRRLQNLYIESFNSNIPVPGHPKIVLDLFTFINELFDSFEICSTESSVNIRIWLKICFKYFTKSFL